MIATVVYLLGVIIGGVTFSWLIHEWIPVPYEKVLSRSILLFAAIGLVPLWRKLGLNSQGIGLAPFDRAVLRPAYLIGVALILPLLLFYAVTGFRVWNTAIDLSGLDFWRFVLVAFVSAWLVGIFEESLFRGVFFGSVFEKFGFWFAAVSSSAFYSAVHFIGGVDDVVVENVGFTTGFKMVGLAFTQFTQMSEIWDSALSLFLLGMLFCVVRVRVGLWACIALHSAWVFGIRTFKELTVRDVVNPFASWTGEYDHFVGNLASVWLIFIFVVIALVDQYRQGSQSLPGRA
ncbi:MAG: CPBP family intramembrane glutamic endopeptidase [Pseudomonadota bacterium]